MTQTIEVLDLSGRHIGRNVSVVDKNGWTHTGMLTKVNHEEAFTRRPDATPSAWIIVKSVDGSRWMGRVEAMVTIEAP